MTGITLFYFHKTFSCIGFNIFQDIKRLRVQISIPFRAKYIAVIRLSVTGGGHLEISPRKVNEQNGNRDFFKCKTHVCCVVLFRHPMWLI